MGRLDDLLKKAETIKVKKAEDVFKDTKIIADRAFELRQKMKALQNNQQLRQLLGEYSLRGHVIPIYEHKGQASNDEPLRISVLYDALERKEPYIHFFAQNPVDMEAARQIAVEQKDEQRGYASLREIANKCPELSPAVLEDGLYAGIEKKLDEVG